MDRSLARSELKTFLRTRRGRVSPEAVGLPRGSRRLTPGLRREELAALDPLVQQVLDGLSSTPAFVMNNRWDVVAFNRLADRLYGYSGYDGPFANNTMWRAWIDPARRALYVDWQERTREWVGRFRVAYASSLGDPGFEELLLALRDASPEFARLWDSQHTEVPPHSLYRYSSPRWGRVNAQATRLTLPMNPGFVMVVLLPADAASAAIFSQDGCGPLTLGRA